ncbi:hypothetical protein [Luteolibacter pohnpeiensis]|uniref:hypothetical protein n=1 Tax=Luteolibacter pohnpeiensis TaxID=454153 RepID=UPI001907D5BE|nr:hypothetical protein [Luteolibacter pohnpeiensis]
MDEPNRGFKKWRQSLVVVVLLLGMRRPMIAATSPASAADINVIPSKRNSCLNEFKSEPLVASQLTTGVIRPAFRLSYPEMGIKTLYSIPLLILY